MIRQITFKPSSMELTEMPKSDLGADVVAWKEKGSRFTGAEASRCT
jgi:hypothetical protein